MIMAPTFTSWIVCFLSISYVLSINGLVSPEGFSRRDALLQVSAASFMLWNYGSPQQSIALPAASPDASTLLALIPPMEYDAPATNATLSTDLSSRIETLAEAIEMTTPQTNNARSSLLPGNWKLIYSNGAEITSLATKLPLGFQLARTTQPVGSQGVFENRGTLDHPQKLAHWQTNVIGTVRVAPPGSLNAVGVVNDRGNRIEVDFQVLVFALDQVLGRPVYFQKTLTPKPIPKGQALPANDVTYLDETIRIVRGGDGALFVFQREEEDQVALLSQEERTALIQTGNSANKVQVGIGQAEKSSSPELQFLFQERRTNKKR